MVELPNGERLKQLPLRALVAYAVRCALRVQLLYLKWQDGKADSGPPASMTEAVAEAIALATKFAAEDGEYDLKRGQELEETVIEAVMRAKGSHRGAAFAANAAYAALNAANLAFCAGTTGGNRRSGAEKVVLAVITAADAAAAAHQPAIESAIEDWHSLQLMRLGQYPEFGRPVDPRPEGKLGPLSQKKQSQPSWKDQSPTLRQIKKHENVLEQTREELVIQQTERKKDKVVHEARCEEYEKTIRHLKAEVIPLKRERDDLTKQVEELQTQLDALKTEFAAQDQNHRIRLTEFAGQLLAWAEPKPAVLQTEPKKSPEPEPAPKEASEPQQLVEAIAE